VDEQKPGSLVVNSKHWERSRICEVPLALALLPHGSLADSITAAQIFSQAETAKLFCSDGSAMGAAEKYPSFDRTERIRLRSSFSSNRFAATWTIFQDTPIVRFCSCCTISASVLHRMSSSSHQLLQQLPVR
jgi:hypothetical protein